MTDLRDDQAAQLKGAWDKQIETLNRLISEERKGGSANQQQIADWQTAADNLRKSIDAMKDGETNLSRLQSLWML
ncbi:hypothetical protein FS837_010820 [Tulasnella sp. UAMH 9824]|nr:hypothetical protein FS837_010820 [Tulasnella sp. UAMH 9824]